MRLIKLTIQAFGPFKDKVVIDFKNNNIDHGILLITGDTGSGKTSIFDAVCFALYGETSGNNRKSDSLRSDFASDEIDTFVELEFNHNNKNYTIKRTPKYLRRKSRGEGYTEAVPTAEFEINERCITKPTLVTKEITDLLGLDSNQFKQVFMLSQGEFTKFLLASSDEKTSIFRKIFNTNLYSNIMYKLKEESNKKEQIYKETKDYINKEINNINYDLSNKSTLEIIEFLEEKIKELDTTKKEKETIKTTLRKELDSLIEELNKIRTTNKQLIDLDKNNNELNKLLENNKDIDSIKDIYSYNINISKEITNNKNLLNKEEERLSTTNNELTKYNNLLKEVEDSYNKNIDKYKILDNHNELIDKLNTNKNTITNKIKELENIKVELNNYETIKNKLSSILKEYTNQNNKYTDLESKYYLNEAFILSEKLIDNEPCPVCGSIHHPNKATNINISITKDELEEEKNKLEELKNNKELLEAKLETITESLKDYLNIDISLELTNLNKELNTIKEEIIKSNNEYESLLKEKNKYEKDIYNYKNLITDKTNNINKITKDIENIKVTINTIYKDNNTSEEEYNNKTISNELLKEYYKKINNYDTNKSSLEGTIKLLKEQTKDKKYINIEDKENIYTEKNKNYKIIEKEYIELNSNLDILIKSTNTIKKYVRENKKQEEELTIIKLLSDTANAKLVGKQKITFENYVQSYYLNNVLIEANKRLSKMTDNRYELQRKETSNNLNEKLGLEFSVFDAYTGKTRDVSTLSGGEMFKASLSLALGLSDIISMYAGGIKVDSLFVDEGFGSLDQESLNQSLNILNDLSDNDKLIGIISHVTELINRIDNKIIVKKTNNGSTISIES